MAWSAKRKAIAFSAILILVSTAFLVTAAATAQRTLEPFRTQREFGLERSLTRQGVALGVGVGTHDAEGNLSRAAGATVSVFRHVSCDAPRGGELVDSKTTGERGLVVFQLRRGCYHLEVTHGGFSARSGVYPLRDDLRVGVSFAPDGSATWHRMAHQEMERRGDVATLTVRVIKADNGTREPVAGATVNVYAPARQDAGQRVLVANGTTGPRGFVQFQLHNGNYGIEVLSGAGNAVKRVAVHGDTGLVVCADCGEPGGREAGRPARER